jgi:hypothetical protein
MSKRLDQANGSSSLKKTVGSALAAVIVAGGLVGVSGSPAIAGCPPDHGTSYQIYNKSTVYKGTNLASTWTYIKDTQSIAYSSTKTGTLTASGTATVGADAGVIFAKASTSFSVTVGKSWAKSDSWTYTLKPQKKKGKTKVRMRLYHEAKKFTVRKYTWQDTPKCTTKETTKYRKTITAPVKRNNNIWKLEYK